MVRRVAVAGVFHETNTFSPRATDLAAFRAKRWEQGEGVRRAFLDTRTVVGGFLDGAQERGLDVAPVFGAYATPSGLVSADALDAIEDRLVAGLAAAPAFDGLLLELHGAMVAEGSEDPEAYLLRRVREAVGARPVVVVTDLHANMSPERVALPDVVIGYRTNPHVDTHDRGRQAAQHLADFLDGAPRPAVAHRRVPAIAAPIAQATDAEPLRSVLARAAELRDEAPLADATVHAGYAYADVAHLGMSVTVTAREAAAAAEAAEELAGLLWARRQAFAVRLPPPGEAFADAARGGDRPLPVAVADTGDNVNGGAPGDATWLLGEAIGTPGVRTLGTLWDSAFVRRAAAAGVGSRVRGSAGARSAPATGAPLELDAVVRWTGDGTFVNKGPMATGARESMGSTAVVRAGAVDVVVQERAVQPNDPELFRCCGLEPRDYDVVLLKGAAAVRAGWEGLVSRFVDAGTRGVTDCDLGRLRYERATRPLWPLDRGEPGPMRERAS